MTDPERRSARILVVEDDEPQRRTLAGFLRKRGYEVIEARSAAEAEAVPREVDLLLTDLRLGGRDGIALLENLRRSGRQPDLEAIVLTAFGSVEDAVRAMRAGAYDFLSKPIDLERLEAVAEKALERVSLARENRGLREIVRTAVPFGGFIGESPAVQQVKALALKVAPSRASVLLLGESGTGKEVLARGIHLASQRRSRPFVTVNCAALSETLIESELFGHERGAFTGASGARKGRFELADSGTLFLDEVGDIPPPVQVKLLNVLQSGRFERVGGTETREVDVRLIAATHRDLRALIAAGHFREDLYYRINVVAIRLPSLRERAADIPLLAQHFLSKHGPLSDSPAESIAPDVMAALERWPFPGNVRQLENWIERATVLAGGPVLTWEDFPSELADGPTAAPHEPGSAAGGLEEQVERLEAGLIREALARENGNKSAAARQLGLTERAIRYKIRKYGL